MSRDEPALPFFVYGTLRPGERYHRRFLRGRTVAERPALLAGAVLYDGPGYPYALAHAALEGGAAGPGVPAVTGTLVEIAPADYPQLLGALDELEEYFGAGDPRNVYDRVAREVAVEGRSVWSWVYLAAPRLARELRAGGTAIPGGDWLRRPAPPAPPVPRTP
ncbi:gamma-glutamylcyclotransferase family protein [Streptomyces sp. NPDC006704]|uniref:gamma-glutamylcyclotransferase family protein n=1 Tax=Streptomyces sp. NPDC006704 TaxID=3364760 RepID=UPI0036A1DACA